MITEQEFQEALKIVNLYIEQLNETILKKDSEINKTLISDWIIEQQNKGNLTSVQTRMLNCLNSFKREDCKYIEDFLALRNPERRIRNFGAKSRAAFNELYFKK